MPSSHWGRCTLIRCAGTRNPVMQRWVARTKVIAILLLTYPHVLEYDCFHLVVMRLANLFRVALASTPAVHIPRRQRGRSAGATGGKPPGTSVFFPFPPHLGTALDPLYCASGRRCSRPTCLGHCLSPADRGLISAGCPSFP